MKSEDKNPYKVFRAEFPYQCGITLPHVELIFKLLVVQSKEYANFEVQDDWWAWAQKIAVGVREIKYSKKMMSRNR